jgi:hypothetical protein
VGNRPQMGISDQRALENELRFKRANEEIDERRRELELGGRTPYICECEDERCIELIRLTVEEYGEVRSGHGQFLVSDGHRTRGTTVEERDGYRIVVKDV